ncbi:hypothetical protein TcYC6_0112530 [Trypanosoma cruzi]|nr:hypothetical protein TcYC6_0112530 [Trypanosoma cruzi]
MVALPFHISQYLSAKWNETAALLDLVAPFYRRLFWRICTGEFRLSSEICGSCGIDSPPHGPRVLSGSSPHHREGLGGRPRDGKSAVCGAARGKGSCLGLQYPDQWAAEERGSARPMCGQEVTPTGKQEVLAKRCESIGLSFSRETKSAALKRDASTRIEGGRASPNACSRGCEWCSPRNLLCGGAGE